MRNCSVPHNFVQEKGWLRNLTLSKSILLVLICVVGSHLTGCGPGVSTEEEVKRQLEEIRQKAEAARAAKLSELRIGLSRSFLWGACGYVAVTLLGPFVAEYCRSSVSSHFKIPLDLQVQISYWLYFSVVSFVIIITVVDDSLRTVLLPVLVLLTASAVPFFKGVVPGIVNENKLQRKAAMAQIKSLLMLIFVFYIILQVLRPEGFGSIILQ